IEILSADELAALKVLNANTTGALNKLLVDQLASLPKEDSPKQVWLVEIPFLMPHGTDSLKLEVEHDRGQAAETNQMPCWSVTLTLTPPGLGILYCKVSFVDGVLNTYFRSEDAKTLRMIEQQSEQLRVQFAAVGLKPGHIDMQKGQLGKPLSDKLHHQTLFDDRA
ncbi:MAG: flagellar hook-length control protein FliK, partial [Methylococcaceae bacterium]|nr:flagellar hook-length control protein FliK [Methylococcaceae bacterium]